MGTEAIKETVNARWKRRHSPTLNTSATHSRLKLNLGKETLLCFNSLTSALNSAQLLMSVLGSDGSLCCLDGFAIAFAVFLMSDMNDIATRVLVQSLNKNL